jgi:hypothetical protein
MCGSGDDYYSLVPEEGVYIEVGRGSVDPASCDEYEGVYFKIRYDDSPPQEFGEVWFEVDKPIRKKDIKKVRELIDDYCSENQDRLLNIVGFMVEEFKK